MTRPAIPAHAPADPFDLAIQSRSGILLARMIRNGDMDDALEAISDAAVARRVELAAKEHAFIRSLKTAHTTTKAARRLAEFALTVEAERLTTGLPPPELRMQKGLTSRRVVYVAAANPYLALDRTFDSEAERAAKRFSASVNCTTKRSGKTAPAQPAPATAKLGGFFLRIDLRTDGSTVYGEILPVSELVAPLLCEFIGSTAEHYVRRLGKQRAYVGVAANCCAAVPLPDGLTFYDPAAFPDE